MARNVELLRMTSELSRGGVRRRSVVLVRFNGTDETDGFEILVSVFRRRTLVDSRSIILSPPNRQRDDYNLEISKAQGLGDDMAFPDKMIAVQLREALRFLRASRTEFPIDRKSVPTGGF